MKQTLSILAVAVGMAMSSAVIAHHAPDHGTPPGQGQSGGSQGQLQGQQQGQLQLQGQQQGQIGINKSKNTNTNTATGGSSTNNIGNASGFNSKSFSPEANANSTNVNTAVGGAGGQGGKGGVGIGVGGKANASVTKSGNSANVNVNNNFDPNAAEVAQINADAAVAVANIEAGASRDAANAAPQKLEIVTPGAVTVPNIYPTSPCMGSTSVGVGFMGGSVGGGTSWKDDDCSYRETARMFDQLGYKADGLTVMCESAYAKAAPSCKKIAAQAKAEADALAAAAAAQQVAAREPARTEEKRKTDATVRASATIVPETSNAEQGYTNAVTSDGQRIRSGFDSSPFPSSAFAN